MAGRRTRVASIFLASALPLALAGVAHAANPATLSINCTPKGVSPGEASTCVATVTDTGPVASRVPPTGTVSYATDGVGTFDSDTCALEASGAFSSKCTVAYTAGAISGGTHHLTGTYNGDGGHGRATSAFALVVTPVNDDRASALPMPVPGRLTGTTEGATYADDDPDLCSDAYGPVWYALRPTRAGRVAVRLTVRGSVDAVVAVFRQDRSTLTNLGCDLADVSGVAGVPFDATAGATYLVAVAAPYSAQSGEFTLDTVVVPPVRFPGPRLAHDADLSLDPLLRPAAAFSLRLRRGTTYKMAASARGACVHLELRQRATAGGADLAKSDGCSGYLAYTPGPAANGAFSLVATMPEGAAAKVHVAVRAAAADDLAPGVVLANAATRRGALAARDADIVDVYRFSVAARGDATLQLRGRVHADLLLLDEKGLQLACACDGAQASSLVKRLSPRSYLAVVRARPGDAGTYTLTLRLRDPTATVVRLAPTTDTNPRLAVAARVSPARVGGHLVLELQRFDPLTKWQYAATVAHGVAGGGTTFTLKPSIGAWRVRARYTGSLTASPSDSAWIAFTVDAATGTKHRRASCAPRAAATFTVGALVVACSAKSFGETPTKPATPAKSPAAALRALRANVSGIASLKEPFKSNLLGNLDTAIEALGDDKPDAARAAIDEFVATLRSPPLQAQLTADQRDQLVATAKEIESRIGG